MENEFKEFLNRVSKLKQSSIEQYIGSIRAISEQYEIDIYKIDNLEEYKKHKNKIFSEEEFIVKNKDDNHNRYSAAMNHYEEFLTQKPYFDKLKEAEDIEPDKHDGSYELVREIVKQYGMMFQENSNFINNIGYQDADLIHGMTLRPRSRSIEKKLELIKNSNLDDIKKNYLKMLFEYIVDKTKHHKYFNENAQKDEDTLPIGMFGASFGSFSKYSDNDENYRRLIKICINVNNMENEEEILNYVEKELQEQMKGIQSGSISTILHCIKPNIFPIFNNKQNEGTELYKILGIQLHNEGESQNYIENARKIKEFRDNNFSWKNYRVIDLIHLEKQETSEKPEENIKNFVGENIIYYGVPGCGKSTVLQEEVEESKKFKNGYRILFHPEYTYSDFIGQLLPQRTEGGKVTYEFEPGPFTEILKQALNNLDENYYLIIEELNRGNAPAIFGDIFQLLDRLNGNKGEYVEGDSKFPIKNKQILDEINKDRKTKKLDKLYIPHNLSIYATMNTNDQNVFTLDTAFKRRWHFKRITNKFDNKHTYKNREIGQTGVGWQIFVEKINEQICQLPDIGINNEDKQIGKYFLSEKELENDELFAEKLLPYLWEDVLKFNKYEIFKKDYKTLEQLIDGYNKIHMGIFNINFDKEVKDESELEN